MQMTSKNPFEIRAEMLQLAKEYMDQQYHMNVQFAEKMMDQGKKTAEELKEMYKMYSMEELMEKAKEMYSFVSKKD
jgi:competence transcription factor ComK